MVENAGLLDKLREPGQLTLFAPTNAAFQTLSAPVVDALLQNNACVDGEREREYNYFILY